MAPAALHWQALMQAIAQLHSAANHARTLVLLPFVQLLPSAKQAWLAQRSSGLMPRFETSSTWGASLPPVDTDGSSYTQNRAQDSLGARSLLGNLASLKSEAESLCAPLLDLCAELAPLAASLPSSAARAEWGQRWAQELPSLLPAGDFLNTERSLQASAAAWLGLSNFASDALFSPAAGAQFDQLLLVQGLRPDPLGDALADFWQAAGKRVERLALLAPLAMNSPTPLPHIYPCADGADLLAHSALAVLQHIERGEKPVALIAQDRHATRQLSAMLQAQGARIKDETGWKLSTTHAASLLWALLEAALQPQNNAAQIAWLHACLPSEHAGLAQLEKQLGRSHSTLTHNTQNKGSAKNFFAKCPLALPLLDDLAALGSALPHSQKLPIADWQNRLHTALALHGQHSRLQQDEAGAQILRLIEQDYAHSRPISLRQFANWLRDVLENAHFLSPSAPQQPDVVVLPAAQLLGRNFAAVVWPGVDAKRLPLLPKSSSALSHAQRSAIGLPSAEDSAAAQQQAFLLALQQPRLTLLWQKMDGEQALAASPLLQAWQAAQGQHHPAALPHLPDLPHLPLISLPATPQLPPQAQAGALRLKHISASGYEALRRCPYQFFTQQLLGLRQEQELEQDPDHSDWGTLVHATLKAFHDARLAQPDADASAQLATCAEAEMQTLMQQYSAGNAAQLLPYRHSWPQLAAHYLAWLAQDESTDWRYAQGEYLPEPRPQLTLSAPEAPLPLTGRIDRLDRNAAGQLRVIDYKTGSSDKLKKLSKTPLEDTQLPFYALLLGEQQAQLDSALYLAVNEKDQAEEISQQHWQDAATALQTGMQSDFNRIYAGAPMAALGHEEKACQYCEARGLCRKGQWQPSADAQA
jgi:ATP-dependent helicase/nuclease subunit B